ncbi:hypothetical protein C4K03_3250 [Pseudomonas synxantha]|uniref:Uncharacterized protein n=1 Tax=Pseudomonas synxantha TaxID=47883 RepID=A0A3G7U7V9_9PSED|nr:hypothetical protein C4K03_3250 [Pseudomonas synxantha]
MQCPRHCMSVDGLRRRFASLDQVISQRCRKRFAQRRYSNRTLQ